MDDPSHGRSFPPPPRSYLSRFRPNADADPLVYELSREIPGLDGLDDAFEAFHLSSVPYHHHQQQQQPSLALYGLSSSLQDSHISSLSALCSSELVNDAHAPFLPLQPPYHHGLLRAQHAAVGFERSEAESGSLSFQAAPSRWTNSFPVDNVGGSRHVDCFHQSCMARLAEVVGNRQPPTHGAAGFLTGLASPRYGGGGGGGGGTLFPLDVLTGQNARTRDGHGHIWRCTDIWPGVPDGFYRGGRGSRYGDARTRIRHRYADSWRALRVGRSKKYSSVDEVWGDVLGAAKDHSGSKLFSDLLKGATAEEVSAIFWEVKDHAVDLMVDVYGSVPFQNLMELCDDEQRMCILQLATCDRSEFFRTCCDSYGSRAVQKLVQLAETEEEFSLLASAMRHNVVDLATDTSGHHVLEHALREFPDLYKQHLVDPIAYNLVEIARDKSGCCIVQRCLDQVNHKECILDEIAENALVLAEDPFGNFVVQHALDHKSESATVKILKQLKGNHVILSVQKFGSNVVEKCLREATEISCTEIVQELISSPKIEDVLKDRFGNYVIQTALEVSSALVPHVFGKLVDLINKHLPSLRNHIYGKRIVQKMNNI